ncbi:MAG: tetratricopeptide repeat protein [Vicinamibacterales bacterium]
MGVVSLLTDVKCARVALLALSILAASPAAFADARSDARAQVEFGIAVARKGLWREAIFRFEKAIQLDPEYAAAYNNLAIGYEHEGQFEKAREAYEKALALDPKNTFIVQNFDFFKELNDRANRPPGR